MDLLQWLQKYERIRDYIVALRLHNSLEVEAVRISYSLVTSLESSMNRLRLGNVAATSDEELIHELCGASFAILRLFSDNSIESWMPEKSTLETTLNLCALAVQTLCAAMLVFSQAHLGEFNPFFLEHSLSDVSLCGSNGGFLSGGRRLYLSLVSLTCVGEMVNSQVMAFTDTYSSSSRPCFDLVITLGDVLDLWGPGEFIPCLPPGVTNESATEWSYGLDIRGGIIYQPSEASPKMHWAPRTAEYEPKGVPFKVDLMDRKTIGALDLINTGCPIEPDPYLNTVARANISTFIEELGTWPESWSLSEVQYGFQMGQYLNAVCNATWIKASGQTMKKRGLEKVDLDFLNKPWGLLLSVCTGVAQRVALREVVAEVMLPMMDAQMEKTIDWKTLFLTGESVIKELKQPTFRAWFDDLNNHQQRTLSRGIRHVLRQICWTGINEASNLVVFCPMFDNSDACVHIPLSESRVLISILNDTERSATFACLTNACFTVKPWFTECQKKSQPQWRNQVSALVTSVCQYEWLGAGDDKKLHEDYLDDHRSYWIGTKNDKRRVTVETRPSQPSRLEISNNTVPWRYFRRAWERLEIIRKGSIIELRERTMMNEDHAREVVIMRSMR